MKYKDPGFKLLHRLFKFNFEDTIEVGLYAIKPPSVPDDELQEMKTPWSWSFPTERIWIRCRIIPINPINPTDK